MNEIEEPAREPEEYRREQSWLRNGCVEERSEQPDCIFEMSWTMEIVTRVVEEAQRGAAIART